MEPAQPASTVDNPTEVENLWFDDGNIILQAGTCLFRLHRSILSFHSPVFRDMFALPQSEDKASKDGLPTVLLHDTAQDLVHVFGTIYNIPAFENVDVTELEDFIPLVAMLRLGHKYRIDQLFKRGVKYLETCFPMTLKEWDKRGTLQALSHDPSLSFVILGLARNFGLTWILPAAFYQCCHDYHSLPLSEHKLHISQADMHTCSIGSHQLLLRQYRDILLFLREYGAPQGCLRVPFGNSCAKHRHSLMDRIMQSAHGHLPAPLEIWDNNSWGMYRAEVCSVCIEHSNRVLLQSRKILWDCLPDIFGLSDWRDLQTAREAFWKGFTL